MTFHPWGAVLKRTLRSLDFPPGSASFLLPEANEALVSSSVMEWRGQGTQNQSQRRQTVRPLLSFPIWWRAGPGRSWPESLWVLALIIGWFTGSFPRGKSFPLQSWTPSQADAFPFQHHPGFCSHCSCAFSGFTGAWGDCTEENVLITLLPFNVISNARF